MAAIMALSVLYVVVGSFAAEAVTQGQIDDLKKQQQEIEKKKQEIQSEINSLEYEQSTTLAKKSVLDDQIMYTQDEIANITEQIATYTLLIIEKEQEVVEAQVNEDSQWDMYKVRLRSMEEHGTISYIAVIFNANSFADLLSRIDVVGEVMRSDERLYEQLKQAKEETIVAKESLEVSKADKEADALQLEDKQDELNIQLEQADALLAEIEANIDLAMDLYELEQVESQSIQAEINQKVEELKKQQQSVVGTGTLVWPTPSSYLVTSEFGRRWHPIYHKFRMHAGIDIGARYGTNCLASDGGTVITSKYSSSYGNYIVISHGGGVTTLYAHLSSRLVSVGDNVSQGDLIGKIGSTGASTGAHLHFEVSVNGTRVNPLQYFSGYTIRE